MDVRLASLGLALATCVCCRDARAQERRATPVDELDTHLAHAFTGLPLALELAAVAATPTLILSGADGATRRAFLGRSQDALYSRYAVDAGYVAPALVPLALFTLGALIDAPSARTPGAASLQAVVVGVATIFTLKWLTGRPYPSTIPGSDATHSDDPRAFGFHPFSLDRGTAWPSGHTGAAFALASSLTAASESWWVGVASYGFAGSIAAGMLVGQHHWLSDVLAGALLGQAIGGSIGRDFAHPTRARAGAVSWQLVPMPMPGATGVVVTGVM